MKFNTFNSLSVDGLMSKSSGFLEINPVSHTPLRNSSVFKTLMMKPIFVFTPLIFVSLKARIALLIVSLKVLEKAVILTKSES